MWITALSGARVASAVGRDTYGQLLDQGAAAHLCVIKETENAKTDEAPIPDEGQEPAKQVEAPLTDGDVEDFVLMDEGSEEQMEEFTSFDPEEANGPADAAPVKAVPTGVQLCPTCSSELTYIEQYNRWYCYVCEEYASVSS